MLVAVAAAFLSGTDSNVAVLPDRTRITLISMSDDPAKRAWRPDGTPAPPVALDHGSMEALQKPHEGEISCFLRIETASIQPHVRTVEGFEDWSPQVRENLGGAFHMNPDKFGPKRWVVVRRYPVAKGALKADITVGVADGPWRTLRSARYRRGMVVAGSIFAESYAAEKLPGTRKDAEPFMAFPVHPPTPPVQADQRLVAFDRKGDIMLDAGNVRANTGNTEWHWFLGDPKSVVRIELQTRPYRFVTFHGVHAQPGH